MISEKQALYLIKIAIYHSILFLAYSFIHPRFNTSNFYYFPLALFIYYVFEFSFTNIKKRDKPEEDDEDDLPLLFWVKFFVYFCFLIFVWAISS